jgi:hypothetical protein
MKKLSVLLLATALVLAFTLPAAALDNIFGGYFRVRAYTDQNFSGTDTTGPGYPASQDVTQTDTRTRLYYTAKFSDTFQFVNKFEFNNTFGDTVGGDISSDGTGIFRIKNSYVDFWTWQKKLQWKIGIQGYTLARGFIFSDDFSGAYVAYNGDGWKIPFLWIKGYEGGYGKDANDSDADYYALNPVFKVQGFQINPYFMYKYSDSAEAWFANGNARAPLGYAGTFNDMKIWWLGADVDYKFEGWNLWGTFIWNGGSAQQVSNQDLDFQGYLFGLGGSGAIGPVGLHGQFVYSSGDDTPGDNKNDSFFNPRGASYYWSEIMGYGIFDNQVSANSPADQISNIWFVGGGADYQLIESLKLGLDVWYAALAQKEQIGASDTSLGTEIDLSATWQIMPKLNLDIVGAYLFAGDGTYDGPNQKDPYEIGTRLSLSF